MSVKDALQKVLNALPEDRLREVLDFAVFVSGQEEREAWRQFGRRQLARAYGADEPEYSLADLQRNAASVSWNHCLQDQYRRHSFAGPESGR